MSDHQAARGSGTDEITQLHQLHDVRDDLTRRLTAWGVSSVSVGAVLWGVGAARGSRLLVGVGRQSVAWGAIDTLIAAVGSATNQRPVTDVAGTTRSLRRLLLVNTGLDVGYLAVAGLMARRPALRGDALGVAVQALALLAIDVGHARRLGRRP